MSALLAAPGRWAALPALLLDAAERAQRSSQATAWFRIGEDHLSVTSDDDALLRELDLLYGDCAAGAPPTGTPHMHCTAGVLAGTPLLALTFSGPGLQDPLVVALSHYRYLQSKPYVQTPGPIAGWRQLVSTQDAHRLLAASDGNTVIVNLEEAPPEYAVDVIVGLAQAAQTGRVLFMHGAGVGIGGQGVLLLGATRSGKSTTALMLAMRGHAFLGDDTAAVRASALELLPLPRTAGLRDGPLADLLKDRVRECPHLVAPGRDGRLRTLVRASDLFPAPAAGPLPLRFAFLLEGFSGEATATPFDARLDTIRPRLHLLVTDTSASWGISPGRDLVNALSAVDLLSRLQCWTVRVGSLEETARLIEALAR